MPKEDLDLDVEAVEPEKKPGRLKWLVIGVAGLLLLVSASFAALYFSGVIGAGDEAPAVAEPDAAAQTDKSGKPAAPKTPQIYLALDPFVVNFDMRADVRFMQVTVQVAARDAQVIERVKEHTPVIRNSLLMLYSSQDPVALNTRAGKEVLLKQSLDEINKALKEQTGSAGLENVYFTSFVMQ
ncbi:MAG: flagellar basal body-associated protein FliL [Gammaproteobacteria bacterium]